MFFLLCVVRFTVFRSDFYLRGGECIFTAMVRHFKAISKPKSQQIIAGSREKHTNCSSEDNSQTLKINDSKLEPCLAQPTMAFCKSPSHFIISYYLLHVLRWHNRRTTVSMLGGGYTEVVRS